MALTLDEIQEEDAERRKGARLPREDPAPSPYDFVPPIDAADITDGQTLVYDGETHRMVPGTPSGGGSVDISGKLDKSTDPGDAGKAADARGGPPLAILTPDAIDKRLLGHVGPLRVNGHSGALGGGAQLPRYTWAEVLAGLLGTYVEQRAQGGAIMCWPNSGTGAPGDGGYASVLQAIDPRRKHGPYHNVPGLPIVWGGLNDLPALGISNFRPALEALRTIINAHRAVAKWIDGDSNVASVGTWAITTSTKLRNSASTLKQTQTSGDTKTFVFPADWDGRDLVVNLAVDSTFAGSVAFAIPGEPAIATMTIVAGDVTQPNAEVASKHNVICRRFAAAASCAGKTLTCTITRSAGAIGVDSFTAQGTNPVLVPGSWRPFSYAIWAGYPHGPAMNDAAVASANALVLSMCAEWTDGLVVYVPVDDLTNKQQAMFDSDDNVHMNENAQTLVAARFYDYLRNLTVDWTAAQKLAGAGSETVDFAYRTGISPDVYIGKKPWDDVWPGEVKLASAVIEPTSAAAVALAVTALPSQTANLTEWRNSAGAVVARVDAGGLIFSSVAAGIGPTAGLPSATFGVAALGAGVIGAAIKGAASQTADLFQAQSSAAAVLAKITAAGAVRSVSDVVANDGLASQVLIGAVLGVAGISFGSASDAIMVRTATQEITTNRMVITAAVAGQTPNVAKGAVSQTADLFSAVNSAVSQLWGITAAGLPRHAVAGNAQTTVGAAGGASALPATPLGYFKFVNSAGTTVVVPFYNA